ncbi:beta-3-deoxy-D-manno-oct-2-ulosonic acid transferase [Comamonas endophytica]|uniref:Beta-3-deoxy-D-manno-oct-2-ulosonic acid transferase n=1 Tax=Comamonas endophytica TaxID=2949090 RepID=A0ABY6GDY4_9BURK|nr:MULTISPECIES: beta-3-deoxy-D-manno-oct-2-ulosonic acid transferase [unclassified Acidovorax]MCD2512430.1 beta-3-deoxy-D-manno-oct-2-ulosonic acid transferase [Acidovorax sp. D4N7]UYG53199.1 beta-3-deoxy-D-manno-oct-2-ulosonic acid transferase [Acidovorax sp. 5MLIR]
MPQSVELPDVSVVYALDFSSWKRSVVCQCFAPARVVFVASVADVPAGAVLAVWGMKPFNAALQEGVRVLRLEDGFLRSVGLGVDLIRPMSWVIDGRGIYYDATRPSDLEHLLANASFDAAQLQRAKLLRERIVSQRLTKYNTGGGVWQRPAGAASVVLVPGQVESDASLAYGAPGIRTNMALLQAARAAHPDAHVVYKPHPDVLAGLRARGADEHEALRWCDEVVEHAPMGELLLAVDHVHVLTSLAGFEALLRGKAVTCHGQPFYSGWGLTRDAVPNARRTRQLSLDELVAGALIEYPLYMSRTGASLTAPEQALDELVAWRTRAGHRLPWWRKLFRVVLRRVVGVR